MWSRVTSATLPTRAVVMDSLVSGFVRTGNAPGTVDGAHHAPPHAGQSAFTMKFAAYSR
jgi:hypothetical protein